MCGRLAVAVYEPDGELVDYREADNTMMVSGLTLIAQAMSYAAVADIASSLGITTAYTLTPLYGAVGSGTGSITNTRTALFTELGRVTAAGSASAPAAGSAGSETSQTFFFGTTPSTWTITEAGVFGNAGPTAGSGIMLDQVLISPSVTKTASQVATLQVTFTITGA